MKRQFYTIIVFLTTILFPFNIMGQTIYEDVVYLKNGSVIHGTIIEQIPNQSIKIQSNDRNIFVYKIDEIEKMTKEQVQKSNLGNSNFNNNVVNQSGYINITELNLGLGVGDYSQDFSFGIQTINGYLFSPYFSIGLGIGVDKYKESIFMPIFADLRVNFLQNMTTPFLSCDFGYSLGFDRNKGGLIINPSFGVKFPVSSTTAMNFSIGYRLQENNNYFYSENGTFLNFKFGFIF